MRGTGIPEHQRDPDPEMACAIADRYLGWKHAHAVRFTTGLDYFVFDVTTGDQNVVIRIGRPEKAAALSQCLGLWQRLSPLGVPLPRIIHDGSRETYPFVIMTRLPGADLGHVMAQLSTNHLTQIALQVADAQICAAKSDRGERFGYAAAPAKATFACWSDVVVASIDRSRRRIQVNGCFPASVSERLLSLFSRLRPELDAMAPIPFLHDTTTKNVIVTAVGDFSGIVDVDDLCYGDPRYAPALTKAALLAFEAGPADYVDPWMARMGLKDDAVFGFYLALFVLDFMSEQGMTFNGNQRPRDPDLIERLPRLLDHLLRDHR